MAISFTYHGNKLPKDTYGVSVPAIFKQTGNRTDVANSAASAALTAEGWYYIVASTTSYVMISSGATDGTNGMHMPAGAERVLWLDVGDKIGCSAGA